MSDQLLKLYLLEADIDLKKVKHSHICLKEKHNCVSCSITDSLFICWFCKQCIVCSGKDVVTDNPILTIHDRFEPSSLGKRCRHAD